MERSRSILSKASWKLNWQKRILSSHAPSEWPHWIPYWHGAPHDLPKTAGQYERNGGWGMPESPKPEKPICPKTNCSAIQTIGVLEEQESIFATMETMSNWPINDQWPNLWQFQFAVWSTHIFLAYRLIVLPKKPATKCQSWWKQLDFVAWGSWK